MKILSGNYKGKNIKLPKKSVRPTKALVRKSVWDIIASNFKNKSSFLDGFSGSGIMGFEAMSRNLDKIVFVDKDRKCIKHIRSTIDEFNYYNGSTKLIMSNITMVPAGSPVDIVFLDPPYHQFTLLKGAINRLSKKNWINKQTNVIVEVLKDTDENFIGSLINISRIKRQGNTTIYFGKITDRANKNPHDQPVEPDNICEITDNEPTNIAYDINDNQTTK